MLMRDPIRPAVARNLYAASQTALPFGSIKRALHVVIDIQHLFTDATQWQVPGIAAVLRPVKRLVRHRPDMTAFARFITPARPEEAQGSWQGYYRHWSSVTGENLAPGLLDILPELTQAAPCAPILDKAGYSVFSSAAFRPLLATRGIGTLILSGVETDVCVLSTVMEAVDLGLRVIVARDAVTSGSDEGHRAALDIMKLRFDRQVEIADSAQIIENWTAP